MWTIISMTNCPWCDKAYDLIHRKDEEAVINMVNVVDNTWLFHLLKSYGQTTVPVIIDPNGRVFRSYDNLLSYFTGIE